MVEHQMKKQGEQEWLHEPLLRADRMLEMVAIIGLHQCGVAWSQFDVATNRTFREPTSLRAPRPQGLQCLCITKSILAPALLQRKQIRRLALESYHNSRTCGKLYYRRAENHYQKTIRLLKPRCAKTSLASSLRICQHLREAPNHRVHQVRHRQRRPQWRGRQVHFHPGNSHHRYPRKILRHFLVKHSGEQSRRGRQAHHQLGSSRHQCLRKEGLHHSLVKNPREEIRYLRTRKSYQAHQP
mmetsp:Transcript_39393/g.63045  ORF Transcript_39393/g.63045 Transcript_39393/m.63045 type:complete len:241 (+) Transcript_39393:342-1064(+)